MRKSLGILSILFFIIMGLLLFFVLGYRERPASVNKDLWNWGKKTSKELNSYLDNLSNNDINKDNGFLTSSSKTKFFLIKDEKRTRKMIFQQGRNLITDGKVSTDEEKIIFKCIIDYYTEMDKIDKVIDEYDILVLRNYTEEISGIDSSLENKRNELINELVILNNYNKEIKNIYGFDKEKEIDKVIKMLRLNK